MSKPSKLRLGFLEMLKDLTEQTGYKWHYLPTISSSTLKKYGLCSYDNIVITMALKSGYVEDNGNHLYGITGRGIELLNKGRIKVKE